MARKGRIRINAGYLHPDVVDQLEGVAITRGYNSLFPAIEEFVKLGCPGRLEHVEPGSYGIDVKGRGEK